MTGILPQFHHCDCEMCEWLNFGTFFKYPCIVRIYAWFFMHCRNHYSDSHANHVIIAYQLHINGAWVTHMRRIWLMNGDAAAYDVTYENLTIACPRRKWRMHTVHPMYAQRSTQFYGVWQAFVQCMGCLHAEPINTSHYILVVMLANVWVVNMTFICPVQYLNVQFNLSNLISHVHHIIVLITGRMIG